MKATGRLWKIEGEQRRSSITDGYPSLFCLEAGVPAWRYGTVCVCVTIIEHKIGHKFSSVNIYSQIMNVAVTFSYILRSPYLSSLSRVPFPSFWSPASFRQSPFCSMSCVCPAPTCTDLDSTCDRICALVLLPPLLYILPCVWVPMCTCTCAHGGWGLKLAVFLVSFSTLPVETRSLTEPESPI